MDAPHPCSLCFLPSPGLPPAFIHSSPARVQEAIAGFPLQASLRLCLRLFCPEAERPWPHPSHGLTQLPLLRVDIGLFHAAGENRTTRVCPAEPSEARSPPWLPPISLSLSPPTLQPRPNPGSPSSRASSCTPPRAHAFWGFAFGGPVSALVISFIYPYLWVSASLYLLTKKRDPIPPAPFIAFTLSLFSDQISCFPASFPRPSAHWLPPHSPQQGRGAALLGCGLQPRELSEHLVEPKPEGTFQPLGCRRNIGASAPFPASFSPAHFTSASLRPAGALLPHFLRRLCSLPVTSMLGLLQTCTCVSPLLHLSPPGMPCPR